MSRVIKVQIEDRGHQPIIHRDEVLDASPDILLRLFTETAPGSEPALSHYRVCAASTEQFEMFGEADSDKVKPYDYGLVPNMEGTSGTATNRALCAYRPKYSEALLTRVSFRKGLELVLDRMLKTEGVTEVRWQEALKQSLKAFWDFRHIHDVLRPADRVSAGEGAYSALTEE